MNFINKKANWIIFGIGAIVFIFLDLRSRALQQRAIESVRVAHPEPLPRTIPVTESHGSGAGTMTRPSDSIPHRPPPDELPSDAAYQISVIEEAVLAAGTNFSHTLPEMQAARFWLIGNLMLDEVYQSQYRHGGRENISSNLAQTQLSQYLKSGRAETK